MEWARRKVFHGFFPTTPKNTEIDQNGLWWHLTFDLRLTLSFLRRILTAGETDKRHWHDWHSRHTSTCVSFMTCYVSGLDQRFPTSPEVMLFFFVVVASTNFRVWLFSHINFCFKPCRRWNGSQETLLGLFLWLDDKQCSIFEFLSCFLPFLLPSPVTPPAPYSPRLPPPCSPPLLYISFSQIVARGVKFKWIKQARGEEVIPGITCVIWGWIWSIKN